MYYCLFAVDKQTIRYPNVSKINLRYRALFLLLFVNTVPVTTVSNCSHIQCCRSWSGIRCLSGSVIYFLMESGSRIPGTQPYFEELSDNFLGKKYFNSLSVDSNFFCTYSKINNFQFCKILCLLKKVRQQIFIPLLFWCFVLDHRGPGIRDSECRMDKNQNQRWIKIRTPDPG